MQQDSTQIASHGKLQVAIDVAIFTGWIYLYSYFTDNNFARNLGTIVGSGILGWPAYRLTDKLVLKGRLSNNQSQFRQYVIGAILLSAILLPGQIKRVKLDALEGQANSKIAHHIGEIYALCEANKLLATQECPSLNVLDGLARVCMKGVESLAPPAKKDELRAHISTNEFAGQISVIKDQITKNISTARASPNYSREVMCRGFEDLMGRTYQNASNGIASAKSDLEIVSRER